MGTPVYPVLLQRGAVVLQCLNTRTPFHLVDTDDKEPQGQRQFGDKRYPLKIRDRQCEEEPEAVDPVSYAGDDHQQAENCRKKPRLKDEDSDQDAEHAKERQTHAEGIAKHPYRTSRESLKFVWIKGVAVCRKAECEQRLDIVEEIDGLDDG